AFHKAWGRRGVRPPRLNGERARRTLMELHGAIRAGLVRSCHDLSDGGLLVAIAEMVLAGQIGARIDLRRVPTEGSLNDVAIAFSERPTPFLVEVAPGRAGELEKRFASLPIAAIGETTSDPTLEVTGPRGDIKARLTAETLEAAWRPPLTRKLEGS